MVLDGLFKLETWEETYAAGGFKDIGGTCKLCIRVLTAHN